MYKFGKYGSLWLYNGIPVCADKPLITRRELVKWYPWNWVLLILFQLVRLIRLIIVYISTTKQPSDTN